MDRIAQELSELKNHNQFRQIPDITEKYDGKIIINGREMINFASNDYLGISTKSFLSDEFLNSEKHSFSSASARLLSGSSKEFSSLEKTLSNIFNKEGCLIYNTGYQCNLGVISALCQKGDVVFSDKLNHASIIDGMRLSEGEFVRYPHLDYDRLEALLKSKRNNYKRAIIISESVFSMDGDTTDIKRLTEIKNKYNCLLMIDEAHAFCACGDGLTGISGGNGADIITATFGKSLGSFGAFCVSDNKIIDYLINKSRAFIFSTSIPPVNIAWTNWLLTEKREYLNEQKQKLNNLTRVCHKILKERNIFTPSNTQIIPVITGSNENTVRISEKLIAEGYYIPAIRPPTVKEGTSRLRISLTADINYEDFCKVLDILSE